MNNRPHWADTAIAIFTGLMLVTYITANYFSCQQLKLTKRTFEEVQKGGGDTHALAEAAGKQANAAKATAESTKDIANRSLAQANATNVLARETRRAADIATGQVAADIQLDFVQAYHFRDHKKERIQFTGAVFNFGKSTGHSVRIAIKLALTNHSPSARDYNFADRDYKFLRTHTDLRCKGCVPDWNPETDRGDIDEDSKPFFTDSRTLASRMYAWGNFKYEIVGIKKPFIQPFCTYIPIGAVINKKEGRQDAGGEPYPSKPNPNQCEQ